MLREVFDYDYTEIASILGKEEAACRQMLTRARKHIAERRPRFKPSPEAHREILNQFIHASGTGELDGLMKLLSEDVVMWADGGGKARGAAIRPLYGREAVARFILNSTQYAPENRSIEMAEVNGELAVILRADNKPFVLLSITTGDGLIIEVRAIGNPDKLNWLDESKHHPSNYTEEES